jgi:hypothetical protein
MGVSGYGLAVPKSGYDYVDMGWLYLGQDRGVRD